MGAVAVAGLSGKRKRAETGVYGFSLTLDLLFSRIQF